MANNDFTRLVFSAFLKEYSILGNELKEKFIIKIKMSDEANRVKSSLFAKGQSQWGHGEYDFPGLKIYFEFYNM
jgi:hypothetical protein